MIIYEKLLKPKYNFLKNSSYAISGLLDMLKSESSFKIELILFVLLSVFIYYIDFSFISKFIMFVSMFLVLLCEAINSSIERVVDLVSPDYHILAKKAKDIGSFVVFISIVIVILIWLGIFYIEFALG